MKEKLTENEMYALARMKQVELAAVNRLRGCLDVTKVRKELVVYEFKYLAKDNEFSKSQIITGLMKKHGVSKSYIEQIIYAKNTNKGRSCVRCGKLISTYKWGRNNGVCDSCISKAIKNYDLYETEQSGSNNETDVGCRNEEPSGGQHPDTFP